MSWSHKSYVCRLLVLHTPLPSLTHLFLELLSETNKIVLFFHLKTCCNYSNYNVQTLKKNLRVEGTVQLVECLPRMLKTQGLIPSSAQKLGTGPVEVTQWVKYNTKHYTHNHHIIEEETGIVVQY